MEKSLRRGVFVVALTMSRISRPVAAFAGWKRPLRVMNGIHWGIPGQQGAFRVHQSWPHCTSCQTRLFSADQQDDAAHVARRRRDSSETKRHKVLGSIEESLESRVLSYLPESSKDVVILVGVSGGCDSTCLLHALVNILTRVDDGKFQLPNHLNTSFQLHVVHFNHKQRGDASDGDARFVQDLCEELNLPCHVYEWNDTTDTAFSQDKARQWRRSTMYSLLQSLTDGQNGVILTAHHRDDSEETMMLKMLRGVHLTNLAGMEPVIVASEDMPNAIIARPMLDVRKEDIIDFLTLHQLPWREDESNASGKYLRNRVRNELIPLLRDMMGGADVLQKRLEHVSQQSSELNEDLSRRIAEYLADTKEKEVFVLSDGLLGLVEREALHQWARSHLGFPLPYDQLQRIRTQLEDHPNQQKWTLQVGGGWNIVRNGATLSVMREGMEDKEEEEDVKREIDWSIVPNDGKPEVTKNALHMHFPENSEYVDEKSLFILSDASHTRKWHFTPPRRKNPIELRDFLRGQKVPLHRRGCAPVIYLKRDEPCLIAVFVERQDSDYSFGGMNGKWIVDAEFSATTEQQGQRIRLQLP